MPFLVTFLQGLDSNPEANFAFNYYIYLLLNWNISLGLHFLII